MLREMQFILLISLLGGAIADTDLDLINQNSRDIWNWVDHRFNKDTDSHTRDPLALSIPPALSTQCLHHLRLTVSLTMASDPHPSDIQELCHHIHQCYLCGILSFQMKELFDAVLACGDRQHYKRAPWAGAERRYDALLQVLGSKMSGGKRNRMDDGGIMDDEERSSDEWGRYEPGHMPSSSSYSAANDMISKENQQRVDKMKLTDSTIEKRQAESVGDATEIYPFADDTLGAFVSDLALETYAAMLKQDHRQIRGDNRSGGRRTRPFVG